MKITNAILFCAVVLLNSCNSGQGARDKAGSGSKDPAYISEGVSEVVTTRQYHLSIDVPGMGYAYIDEAIAGAIDSIKTEFINLSEADTLTSFPYDLQIHCDTFVGPSSLRSYMLTSYVYTGGAHGNTFLKSFTFDTEVGKRVGLEEVLSPYFDDRAKLYETIGGLVMAELTKRFGDNPWVVSGSGSNPDNYRHFVVDGESVVLYFPPYQVASYADGLQTVQIGFDKLK